MPLPRHVFDLLAGRTERLGAAAVQALSLAAVAGQEASYPLLRAASDLPDAALLDALDTCLVSRVLRETPEGYRFGHPLQCAALYERLGRAWAAPGGPACTAVRPRPSSSSTPANWQWMARPPRRMV